MFLHHVSPCRVCQLNSEVSAPSDGRDTSQTAVEDGGAYTIFLEERHVKVYTRCEGNDLVGVFFLADNDQEFIIEHVWS